MKKSSYNAQGSGPKPSLGVKSSAKGLARPGVRAAKSATAPSVSEANGKLARPGYAQAKPQGASGRGTIARPGWVQDLKRGTNTKPTKNMQATTDG